MHLHGVQEKSSGLPKWASTSSSPAAVEMDVWMLAAFPQCFIRAVLPCGHGGIAGGGGSQTTLEGKRLT